MQFRSLTRTLTSSLGFHFSSDNKHWQKLARVALFSAKKYDQEYFDKNNAKLDPKSRLLIEYHPEELTAKSARFAQGFDTVCAFVNDRLDAACLTALKENGVNLIAMRCAGFNNIDLEKAHSLGLKIVRVPAYSPYAVAEHAMALFLAINRKIPKATTRTKEGNFSLDGLTGFDFHGKTVGIVGAGKIGRVFASICRGFGLNILYYDIAENQEMNELGGKRVTLDQIYEESKLISLHCPLTAETKHLINKESLNKMKQFPIIVNTGRGALIESKAIVNALKKRQIAGLGMDVYEQEEHIFFRDLSGEALGDDVLARLLTFPNVIVTAHQAFFTDEALNNICNTTLNNIVEYRRNGKIVNEVPYKPPQ
jgi:D-lactate dehydrogenase